MNGSRYVVVNGARKKTVKCLKFWLAFFVIATAALAGVVIWLCMAAKNGQSPYAPFKASDNGLAAASGYPTPEVCILPAASGPCKANLKRYFYDSTTGACKDFIYGGCSGNDNNFETFDDCMRTCSPKPVKKPDFCMLENDPGPCYAALPRYAYDNRLDKCVQFKFGGCGGNRNNFESKEHCEKQCKEPKGGRDSVSENPGDTSVCFLSHETGICRGYVKRWGFDKNLGACVQFVYGGCGGNGNNFESLEACEKKCLAHILSDQWSEMDSVCKLPQDSGPCRGSIRRWSYDVSRRFCVEFTYGGCQGNSNNFETREACEAKCPASPSRNVILPILSGGISSNPICKLPQDTGPCRAQLLRWAFDVSKDQCVQFTYGGCRGNENNFETIQQCEAACGGSETMDTSQCHLPLEVGKCRGFFKKWGFDASSGQCIQFVYGGCGGNSNNFETKEACEQHCRASIPMPLGNNDNLNVADPVCKLVKDPGPCRGSISRWAFDSQKRECTQFFYGGCQGNGNNFETREACEAKCSFSGSPVVWPISNVNHMARNSVQQIPTCQLPHERGECIAYIPRWGFNAQSGKCVQFIYGGCGGNANNFETQEDCEKKCNANASMPLPGANSNSIDPICKLPKEVGPCRASNKRWAYDYSKGICEEFTYGGCRGNANNFESKETCEQKCLSSPSPQTSATNNDVLDNVCRLPQDTGPCRSSVKRWSYDVSKGSCVEFIYGGCRGNDNNFETREVCEQRCQPSSSSNLAEVPATMDLHENSNLDQVCSLPAEVGPCKAASRRWVFNAFQGGCVEFTYGGCGGNANNFKTREACEARCGKNGGSATGSESKIPLIMGDNDVCFMPHESGNCYGYFERWGFEPKTEQCVMFIYGGCGGNDNNFESKEACELRCIPALPSVKPALENGVLDPVCRLSPDVGPCQALVPRWAFDASQRRCIEFSYGGCRGNDNNFHSKEVCEAKCGGVYEDYPSPEDDNDVDLTDKYVCHLPHERGSCGASLQRWGFDASNGRCVQFIYSGCAGNDNNFETKDICEQRCLANIPSNTPTDVNHSTDPDCRLPMEVGPCGARLQRWYYDTSSAQCLEFFYGGCRGNANQFQSKEACEAKCKTSSAYPPSPPVSLSEVVSSDTSICYLPHESGDCEADMRRWGFHADSGKCIQFHYGGCGGNANNFRTKTECEQRCLGRFHLPFLIPELIPLS